MSGERSIIRGWEKIAEYMDVTPRHAQRLAKERGLPVHRHGNLRARFAYQDEVDDWMALQKAAPEPSGSPSREAARSWAVRALSAVGGLGVAGLVAAMVSIRTAAPDAYNPMSGEWTWESQSWTGRSTTTVGRLDTGLVVGPGSSVRAELVPLGGAWSGGLEVFQDETHWTLINLSPHSHELVVWRYPSGDQNRFRLPQITVDERVTLTLDIGPTLRIGLDGESVPVEVAMNAWDITAGHLVVRTGKHDDEWGPVEPGLLAFSNLAVEQPQPQLVRSWEAHPLPQGTATVVRPLKATLYNADDQLDLLLNGKRIASTGYLQTVELDLAGYVGPGHHTLTLQVFNRQMGVTYGIQFVDGDEILWKEECGRGGESGGTCPELGERLGLVRTLSYRLQVNAAASP